MKYIKIIEDRVDKQNRKQQRGRERLDKNKYKERYERESKR